MLLAAGGTIMGAAHADAQTLSLPKLDNVNFFLQAGSLIGSHDLVDDPSSNEKTFGELGWGFETSFDMLTSPTWDVELSVGYDQMFMRARFVNRYNLRGTIRNLPSISIYASHDNGLYAGLGTGPVSLSNVSAFSDGHRAFAVGGDTFDLSARLGLAKRLGGNEHGKDSRASLFVELAYHARFIGNVSYGTGAPDTLPASLFFGGAVISIGAQVSLKLSASSFDEDVKAEVKHLKNEPWPVPTSVIASKTACASAESEPDFVPVDDYWDPTRCGNPTTVTPNVRMLVKAPSAAEGGRTLEVCAGATLPTGWTIASKRWDPTRCGRPTSSEQNIWRITSESKTRSPDPQTPR